MMGISIKAIPLLVKYGLFVLLTKPRGAAARQPAPLPWPHTLLQASAAAAPSVSDPHHQCSAHLLLRCRWVLELRSPLCTAERCFRFRPAAKLTGLKKLDALAYRRIQDRKSRTYNSYSNAAFLLLSPTSAPCCKPRRVWVPGTQERHPGPSFISPCACYVASVISDSLQSCGL